MIAVFSPADSGSAAGGALADTPIRAPELVDALMGKLPWAQRRWCGFDQCECSDNCANRVVSRAEWLAWLIRGLEAACQACDQATYRVGIDGNRYRACESCATFSD